MKKENVRFIFVGIGINLIFLILNVTLKDIPTVIAIIVYIVGSLLILYGLIYQFTTIMKIWEVIMDIRFRLPFFLIKRGESHKDNIEAPSWIQEVLHSDKNELGNRIHIFRERWFFDNIRATEPFMEVIIRIVNAAVFPIIVESVEGSFQIQGTKCNWDATMSGSRIPHGDAGNVRIYQRLLKETVDMMIKLQNERNRFMVGLDTCRLMIRAEEPGVENKPIKISIGIREQVSIT